MRLLGVLSSNPRGAPVDLLLRAVGGNEGSDEARRRMLTRDVEQLNLLGYDVRNVAEAGAEGSYVMRAHDNRLQVSLTPDQRRELLRAALAAELGRVAPHLGAPGAEPQDRPGAPALDLVQRAVSGRCLVRFEYKGTRRVVHPARVHSGPSGWYLTGSEEGSATVKEFVVGRMSDVVLDAPRTARPPADVPHRSLDPLTWLVDPPTEVVLATGGDHIQLVENLLGTPAAGTDSGQERQLTYVVTNRAMFRRRIYELGRRVRVLSPADVREEIVAELAELAGERS